MSIHRSKRTSSGSADVGPVALPPGVVATATFRRRFDDSLVGLAILEDVILWEILSSFHNENTYRLSIIVQTFVLALEGKTRPTTFSWMSFVAFVSYVRD